MELVLIEGGLVVTVTELNMKSPYKNLSWFDVGVLIGDKINFPHITEIISDKISKGWTLRNHYTCVVRDR